MRVDKPVVEITTLPYNSRYYRGFARDVNTVCMYGASRAHLYDLRDPGRCAAAFDIQHAQTGNYCTSSAAFASEHLILAVTAAADTHRDNYAVIDIRAPIQPVGIHPFHGRIVTIV
jgi:hypothetical protein